MCYIIYQQESVHTLLFFYSVLRHFSDLMIAPVLIQQRDDRFDVILLDNIEDLWTLNQHTIQHLQDSCHKNTSIYK